MRSRWLAGRAEGRTQRAVALAVGLVLLTLAWVFGTRLYAIVQVQREVAALAGRQAQERGRIAELQQVLAQADRPQVIEREARLKLRWGYPDEERIILLGR